MNIYKKWFFILILPAVILYSLVILVPFFTGLLYSFTDWRGVFFLGSDGKTSYDSFNMDSFIGLDNYRKALASEEFRSAFIYTVEYTVLAVISITLIALILALVLDTVGKAVGFFRATFFLPGLLGGLALGFIWQFIFDIVFTNFIFGEAGLNIPFFQYMTQDREKALVALVIMTTWQFAGYMMIIFITGINNIPNELNEAASIDGAGKIYSLRKITLPMLMPSFTVVLFLNLANSFKLLDQNVALTDGAHDTRLLALQILKTIEKGTIPNYGVAQAQAVIFFIVIAIISLTQVVITKRKEVEL